MKRVIILIPVFNDWDSLIKLLSEINKNIDNLKNFVFDCFIVNDASTMKQPKIKKPSFINLLKILNMKRNQGHGRCNAFGIKYIKENESNFIWYFNGFLNKQFHIRHGFFLTKKILQSNHDRRDTFNSVFLCLF